MISGVSASSWKTFIKFCWPREKLTISCVFEIYTINLHALSAPLSGLVILFCMYLGCVKFCHEDIISGHSLGTFFGNILWEHFLSPFFVGILEKNILRSETQYASHIHFSGLFRVGAIAPTLLRKNFKGKGCIWNDFGSQVIHWPVKLSTQSTLSNHIRNDFGSQVIHWPVKLSTHSTLSNPIKAPAFRF